MLSSKLFRGLLWLSQLLLLLIVPASILSRPRAEIGSAEKGAREQLSCLRMPFVANSGQIGSAVAYYATTLAGSVFVTRDGQIVYSLPAASPFRDRAGRGAPPSDAPSSDRKDGWSLTETPLGGRGLPRGAVPSSISVSYFIGNDPSRWGIGLPTFESVSLGEVWPGISLDLRVRGESVEKLFTVEPGGDPSRIRMSLAGAKSLRTDRDGALVASTGLGDVRMTRPAAYQERRGARRQIQIAYDVRCPNYGFRLGEYDPSLAVVIDPVLQATYLGGTGLDVDGALVISAGEAYVAGRTTSTNFPGTAGGAQTSNGGGIQDAFVARLNAALTTLKQVTYLGGSGDDSAFALAVSASGDVYVAGSTTSTNFPGTASGAQTSNGGGFDAFVARLNAALTTLKQATYLGGSGQDFGEAFAISTSGEVYVAGLTTSTNFPKTAGGAQTSNGGGIQDAFVARLNAALTTLNQATYLGGSGEDAARTLAIPASGQVFVAGPTASGNFPGTAGGAQTSNGGGFDAFVARLNAALTSLNQATYLGGSNDEFPNSLAISASGEVFVAGTTHSSDLPGTAGGAQDSFGGGNLDAFVARLNATLTTLNQATYFGGSGDDFGRVIVLSGEVFLAGTTDSSDLPGTAGGAQAANGGSFDAYVTRLAPNLRARGGHIARSLSSPRNIAAR